ncbi:unnamed protein product [Miscanthus lutarioriparius]|uniref:non-specific serine/threonine protein kinase n=1 Tax=Miscanthus lutarioriparius TaxID=422564 RepID=A0A811SFB7_9POAL|nr:unnamed protein product [Miscanthus lutarioriparius]
MSQSQLSAIVINITLDGQNYLEWAFTVETALRGHGLYFHLTDDPPTLKSDNSNAAAVKTWEINDGKIMAAMDRYVQESGALQHTLMQQLHVIEQRDMSIDEYYSAFDGLMGSLVPMVPQCTAGQNCTALSFIEQFLTYRFVMGVRAEFDSIGTRLLHTSSTLTMAKALSDLLAKETRLQALSSSVPHPHSVLAASQRTSAFKEPYKHCGRTNHSSDTCFAKHPEKLAEFHARRAARGRGTSSTPRGSGSIGTVSVAASLTDRCNGKVIGTGHRRKGASSLYVLDTLRLPSSVASTAHASFAASSSASFSKWHHCLGHLCGSRLSSMINKGCLSHASIESSFHCGTLVWSTNTTGKSVVGMNLTGSGNLVLLDHRNMEVLHFGQKLIASTSATNWAKGKFYLTVLSNGMYAFAGVDTPLAYYQSPTGGNVIANTSAYIALKNGSLEVFTSFRGTEGSDYSIQFPMNAYGLEFVRLDWDGHLRLYQGGNGNWVNSDLLHIADPCSYPLACGEYGVCSDGQCSCPDEALRQSGLFKLIYPRERNRGCSLTDSLSCGSAQKTSYSRNFSSYAFVKVQEHKPMLSKEKIVIVVVVGSSTFVASVIVSVLIVIRSAKLLQDTDIIDQLPGLPKRFCFGSLKSATGDFSRKIGVRGSGSVFEGHIGDMQVAVKRLDDINQGEMEFLMEVQTVGRINHIHLVSLIGFCAENHIGFLSMSTCLMDLWISGFSQSTKWAHLIGRPD